MNEYNIIGEIYTQDLNKLENFVIHQRIHLPYVIPSRIYMEIFLTCKTKYLMGMRHLHIRNRIDLSLLHINI